MQQPVLLQKNKLASPEAALVQNYDPPTHPLTGVKCRATRVAKYKFNMVVHLNNGFCKSEKILARTEN